MIASSKRLVSWAIRSDILSMDRRCLSTVSEETAISSSFWISSVSCSSGGRKDTLSSSRSIVSLNSSSLLDCASTMNG